MNRNKEKCFIWKHFQGKNGEAKQQYQLRFVTAAPGDPQIRQLSEATLIEEKKTLLNAKDVWNSGKTL